jgi:hypothetical protein
MGNWKRIVLTCLSFVAVGLAPTGTAYAQVKVTAANPSSAYQGTIALDVVVSGSGFNSSAKVQYFVSGTTNPGGITVKNVKFNSSTELVSTIDVAADADLAGFDIIVILDTGRKGKGTTLFTVKQKPNDPPPPTYPEERAWHAFTSNGGADITASRLYMYGGGNSTLQAAAPWFWYFVSHTDQWTLVLPASTSNPGPMQHLGLSCGAGTCVLAFGNNGFGLLDETWVYREATNAWTQATCSRRSPCPSPRQMVTMAFDPQRGTHLLFGGRGSTTGFNDTWTFDTATLKWTARSPAFKPTQRNRAAAVHVPGIGVVMHGGQPYNASGALCEFYAWDGSNWRTIQFDMGQPHPCLHSHDLAWDGQRLLMTGGYVDTSDTPSPTDWRFTFAADGQSGTWSQATRGTCQPIGGTDAVIHPGARMAYDGPTATRVYFGGEINTETGVVRFDNTVECY